MARTTNRDSTEARPPAAQRRAATVAITIRPNSTLQAEALARGWRLLALQLFDHVLPAGVKPRGALADLLPDDPVVRRLRRMGCAVVRLGKLPHPYDDRVPAVLPDVAAEGRLAAEHFAERGFRHVGYVGSDPWSDARTLFESFHDRAAELGMECHLLRFAHMADTSRSSRALRKEREFKAWLREIPKPLAILAPGASFAAKYGFWATEAGYSFPGDIAVLSRGGGELCGACLPTLSSIDQDEEGRMRIACDLLDRMMAGERAPAQPILVPPKGITERESTNLLAVPDLRVAQALRYIWDHLARNLSVGEVAGAAGMSRRHLERAFRRQLGRGINAELHRKRLESFARLLRETRHSIAELAPQAGFHNLDHLYRSFRAVHRMTPRQYRLQHVVHGPSPAADPRDGPPGASLAVITPQTRQEVTSGVNAETLKR